MLDWRDFERFRDISRDKKLGEDTTGDIFRKSYNAGRNVIGGSVPRYVCSALDGVSFGDNEVFTEVNRLAVSFSHV
jgi:hypothetical protein